MKVSCSGCGWMTQRPGGGNVAKYCPTCAGLAADLRSYFTGKFGKVERGHKCVDCGRSATCRDHRDYAKLDVFEYVCSSCNKRRGPAKFPIYMKRQAHTANLLRDKIDKLRKQLEKLKKELKP